MKDKPSAQQVAEHLDHFITYVSSPWRLVWINLVAGIFRGFGAIVGATVVIAVVIWLLSVFANIPGIGEYFEKMEQEISEYANKIDYEDELKSLEKTLKTIDGKLSLILEAANP